MLAGVRVLTLDGGGIRGIVELAILAEIERRVGLGISIREMFDVIVGTSTVELLKYLLVFSACVAHSGPSMSREASI